MALIWRGRPPRWNERNSSLAKGSKDEPLSRFPLGFHQLLDDDSLKVYILKQVTTDIEEHLDGVTDALLDEILDEESVPSNNCTLVVNRAPFHPFSSGSLKGEEVTTRQ